MLFRSVKLTWLVADPLRNNFTQPLLHKADTGLEFPDSAAPDLVWFENSII